LTAIFVLAAAVVVGGQANPQQYLNDARSALDSVPTTGLSEDNAKTLADVRRDFASLETAYRAPEKAPSRSAAQQASSDWQRVYAAVQTDLILATDTRGPGKGRFDRFQAALEKFYNAAIDRAIASATAPQPQTTSVSTACPSVAPSVAAEATVLLDRIQTLVDDALNGKATGDPVAAKSGVKELREAGRVSIERTALDEILAEVGMLRLMLQSTSAK
jgi:hypothetical protein